MLNSVIQFAGKQVENYKKPTPKWWAITGIVLKVSGKAIAGSALLGAVGPWIGLIALIGGEVLGEIVKFKIETN